MSNQKPNIVMEATIEQHVDTTQENEPKVHRTERKRQALMEAAKKVAAGDEAASPHGTVEVVFHKKYFEARELTDEWYAGHYDSAEAFRKQLARRIEKRPHLPRVGEVLSDDVGELYFVSEVWHNLEEDTDQADVTIWIGTGRPEDHERPDREGEPFVVMDSKPQKKTADDLLVTVVFDEEYTTEAERNAEFEGEMFSGIDGYLDRLQQHFESYRPLPSKGDVVKEWDETRWYVTRVEHMVDPDEPDETSHVCIWLGSSLEPVEDEPPTAGERRIPERIYAGARGEGSTISVVEDMHLAGKHMEAQIRMMRLVLEREIESEDHRSHHYDFKDILGSIEAELDLFRSRFASILNGYYGEGFAE